MAPSPQRFIQMPISTNSLRAHVVVRVKRQLHKLDVLLNKSRVFQFAQLPCLAKPGSNTRFRFRLQFRVFQSPIQIRSALFYK